MHISLYVQMAAVKVIEDFSETERCEEVGMPRNKKKYVLFSVFRNTDSNIDMPKVTR